MAALVVSEQALVVLVGTTGAGKSTFATRHFAATEVLAADAFLADRTGEADEPPSKEAMEVHAAALASLRAQAAKRLAQGLLTVVDASNVSVAARAAWVALAREHHVPAVAVVLDVPLITCLERNAARLQHRISAHFVRGQHRELRRGFGGNAEQSLLAEGFVSVHVLATEQEVAAATLRRERPPSDRRSERGPFDIIGDVHGCAEELRRLLETLGWETTSAGSHRHPSGRKLVFLGDLVDRGPNNVEVLELALRSCKEGRALCVPGNHDAKVLRWLLGQPVRKAHGMQITIDEILALPEPEQSAFRKRAGAFLTGLASHLVLDEGRLVVAHAGLVETMHLRASKAVTSFALYGDTNGEVDEYGLPVRRDWSQGYRGAATVVYGHTPMREARWLNNTVCIDTGCVFGGKLTALRWPERELVAVAARRVYYEASRPLWITNHDTPP